MKTKRCIGIALQLHKVNLLSKYLKIFHRYNTRTVWKWCNFLSKLFFSSLSTISRWYSRIVRKVKVRTGVLTSETVLSNGKEISFSLLPRNWLRLRKVSNSFEILQLPNFPCKSKGIRLRAGSCGGYDDDDNVEDDDDDDDNDDDDDEDKRATTMGLLRSLRVRKTLRGFRRIVTGGSRKDAVPFGTPNV